MVHSSEKRNSGKVEMKELTAQAVFDLAFQPGREPRSEAYKRGVMHSLRVRIDGMELGQDCPYAAWSAETDAYFAGVDEGRHLSPVGQAPAGFE